MSKIEELLVKHAQQTDGFWSVECDVGYNFKYYFNSFNPINLIGTRIKRGKKYTMATTKDWRDTMLFTK